MKVKWSNKAKAIRNLIISAKMVGDYDRVDSLKLKLKSELERLSCQN